MENSTTNENGEAFTVYHEGVALTINWQSVPTIQRVPARRLCVISPELVILLMADQSLYAGHLDAERLRLHLELQRQQIIDVDYCRDSRQLFIVTADGAVLMQQTTTMAESKTASATTTTLNWSSTAWRQIAFDPLGLSEDGVQVERVCCSAQGVLFITRRHEVYVMGSCGHVFAGETQPKHMNFIESGRRVLDVVAGDEHFVILLQRSYTESDDTWEVMTNRSETTTAVAGGAGPSAISGGNQQQQQQPSSHRGGLSVPPSPRPLSHSAAHNRSCPPQLDHELPADMDMDIANDKHRPELTSTSSIRSFSSKSSHSLLDSCQECQAVNLLSLLRQGYALLHTQVYSFGGSNNGLLGTGDHMKRSHINNIQKLDAVGVCSVAAGREHTVVRTLDGRLYQWGLNTKQQLSSKKDCFDLSTPTEIKLDRPELGAMDHSVLEACCGDYHTVMVNARGSLQQVGDEKLLLSFNRDFLTLHMSYSPGRVPLLLAFGGYTLHNCRQFQREYHSSYSNLQTQLATMLRYRHAVQMLQLFQQKSSAVSLKLVQPVCQSYQRVLCMLAAVVSSLEAFYRNDHCDAGELLFIKLHRECIGLFEEYTKAYCDVYSIDGFTEAENVFAHQASVPLMPSHALGEESTSVSAAVPAPSSEANLTRVFQQPFQIFPNFMIFLEQLLKTRSEYREHLLAWQALAQQHRIDLELAESTLEFWQRNERNTKIRHFRRKHRRVILTSSRVHLKMSSSSLQMTGSTFILFSDCLCQIDRQLHTYPLATMWVKKEGDTALRIVTPEKSFTLTARSHHDKMIWYDQLEKSILAALGQSQTQQQGGVIMGSVSGGSGPTMSSARTTKYVFSRNHGKYAGVHAFGRWRNGVMHGQSYLEYPDGKIYFGEMRSGEIEGYGRMVIPSVGLYEGSFKLGKFHGHGLLEMKDNEVYEGNFREGLFHGHGLLRSNYYTYVGEFQGNTKCGYGVLDDTISGDKFMGMFADNKRSGSGTCITMNGDYFEGVFVNGELASQGLAIFENDYYYEGELTMAGPNGKGQYYMPREEVTPGDDGEPASCASSTDIAPGSTLAIMDDEFSKRQFKGNILTGQLSGQWNNVRVISGNVLMEKLFPKYPRSIGDLVVENQRKWRSLFDNFEEQLFSVTSVGLTGSSGSGVNGFSTIGSYSTPTAIAAATKLLWNRIVVFMTVQRDREKAHDHNLQNQQQQQQQHHHHQHHHEHHHHHHHYHSHDDGGYQSFGTTPGNFGRNISLNFWSSFDKLSLKSTSSLLTSVKSSILDLSNGSATALNGDIDPRRSHSQETLYESTSTMASASMEGNDFECFNSSAFPTSTFYGGVGCGGGGDEHSTSFGSFLSAQVDSWASDSSSMQLSRQIRTGGGSYDSMLHISGGGGGGSLNNNNNNNNSFCSTKSSSSSGLEFVPSFGITTLTENDVTAIKEYLIQAFKDRHHPLFLLNQRVANSFYISYGCWKVKPTPILAKLAMREWESISRRVYRFVRKMFPALPEDYCIVESSREVVSHITLLYPIVLSEGIYSTLFVLYANKYSGKDEIYRQNLLYAEKLNDDQLAERMSLESSLLPVVQTMAFNDAVQTLKQLQEKYSPKAMLTVIENCMQQITEANKAVENGAHLYLAADSMMPLTLFLVLRAAVPHLGAELALLDDLTGGANFQFEMNGLAGYCYTTLKAAYEHIIAKPLKP